MARATLKQVLELADQVQDVHGPVRREFALFQHLMRFVERGEITRDELQEVIEGRLNLDRLVQAKLRWSLGWGGVLGMKFAVYLDTIPEPFKQPEAWKRRFEQLVLVDERIPLTVACRLAVLEFNGNDTTFVPFDSKRLVPDPVRWMWANVGYENQGRMVRDCRRSFMKKKDEIGLTAFEGVSLYIQDPFVINGHFMDLPSSVHAGSRGGCAYLGYWDGSPELGWCFDDGAIPNYGSASRGSV